MGGLGQDHIEIKDWVQAAAWAYENFVVNAGAEKIGSVLEAAKGFASSNFGEEWVGETTMPEKTTKHGAVTFLNHNVLFIYFNDI